MSPVRTRRFNALNITVYLFAVLCFIAAALPGISVRVCAQPEAETVKALLKEEMENVVSYSVPLLVDAKIGRSWAEAH